MAVNWTVTDITNGAWSAFGSGNHTFSNISLNSGTAIILLAGAVFGGAFTGVTIGGSSATSAVTSAIGSDGIMTAILYLTGVSAGTYSVVVQTSSADAAWSIIAGTLTGENDPPSASTSVTAVFSPGAGASLTVPLNGIGLVVSAGDSATLGTWVPSGVGYVTDGSFTSANPDGMLAGHFTSSCAPQYTWGANAGLSAAVWSVFVPPVTVIPIQPAPLIFM